MPTPALLQPSTSRPARRPHVALALLTGLAAVLATLAAAPTASAATRAGAGVAWVRAAHLVPGIGSTRVDLAPAAGTARATAVVMSPGASYGDVTSYQKVAPGTYTVTVTPTSGGAAPMLSRRFTIAKGQAMTLAVIGTRAAPRLATLQDDLTPPSTGDVNVRVLPAVSKADALSVKAVNGPVVATDAVLGQATGYRSVPAGSWTLRVSADQMAAATARVSLRAGGVYTVVVLDGAAGALRTKVVTDAEGMAAAAPKGGAQTGGGGTAPAGPAPVLPVLLLAGLAVVLLGVRRLPALVRATARR